MFNCKLLRLRGWAIINNNLWGTMLWYLGPLINEILVWFPGSNDFKSILKDISLYVYQHQSMTKVLILHKKSASSDCPSMNQGHRYYSDGLHIHHYKPSLQTLSTHYGDLEIVTTRVDVVTVVTTVTQLVFVSIYACM